MRYTIATLGFLVAILAGVFAVTWWVDPFGYFGRFPLGLYDVSQIRHVKARGMADARPDGVLLGSSTMMGVFPDSVPGCRLYNAAFPGARPTELAHLAEHFLPPVSVAVIGLDFFAFNRSTESEHLAPDFGHFTLARTAAMALSTAALRQVRFTVKMWRNKRTPLYVRDGSAPAAWDQWAEEQARAAPATPELAPIRRLLFTNWEYSRERIGTLQRIRDILQSRGITAVVYINPMGPALMDMLEQEGLGPDLERFRADVRSVFPQARDFSREVTAAESFYGADPLHFPPPVGNAMLSRALGEAGLCGLRPN